MATLPTLYSSKSAYFSNDTNYDGLESLYVGNLTNVAYRFAVDFNISTAYQGGAFPAGTVINSATLVLTKRSGAGTITPILRGINSSWTESTITGNLIDGGSPSLGSSEYPSSPSSYSGASTISFPVTSRVQWWIDNPTRYGFYIYDVVTTGNYYSFYSDDYATQSSRPRLIIDYTLPVTNTAPYWGAGVGFSAPATGIIANSATSITASWGAASDADANIATYWITPYINGSAQTEINAGLAYSYNYTIPTGNAGYQYYFKVRASDTGGLYSTYITSNTVTKNTLPTWNSTTVTVDGYSSPTIIPENDSSLEIVWSAGDAKDTGQTLTYDVWCSINGGSYSTSVVSGTTSLTATHTIASPTQGTTYQYRVDIRDGLDYGATSITSELITANTLTGATLASVSSIAFASASVAWTWSGANDTTDATNHDTFTYRLSSSDITIYNQANDTTTPFTMLIWRTGDSVPSSTTPYIKFDDIKTKFAGTSYQGSLIFTLTTTNYYGSPKTSNKTITVDLRTNPISLGTPTTSGTYTISSVQYYIPNRTAVIIDWTAATDPLGGAITYDVQVSLAGGAYSTFATGLITNTTTYSTTVALLTTCQFKVIARATYGNSLTSSASTSIDLHYYNAPTVVIDGVARTQTGATVTGTITSNTSIVAARTLATADGLAYQLDSGGYTVIANTFSPSQLVSVAEASTATFYYRVKDIGLSVVIPGTYIYASVSIPKFTPVFSIREKGVGVNTVNVGADDHKALIAGSVHSTTFDGQSGFYENGVKLSTAGKENYHGVSAIGTLTFSNANHTLTLASVTYWYQGVQYTTASPVVCDLDLTTDRDNSASTLATNKLYFFYFKESDGKLYWSDAFWDLHTTVPVATCYWNGSAGALNKEYHSHTRDIDWHIWAHMTVGARYGSGLSKTYPTTGTPASLQIETGSIYDEDLNISTGQQTVMRGWYMASAGVYTWADYSLPYLGSSGTPQYLDTDTYTLTNLATSKFACYWVFATTDLSRPIQIIPSHVSAPYNTVALARAETQPAISGLNPEWKLIYRFIYDSSGNFQESSDYRLQSSIGSSVSSATNASAVYFNPAGEISSITVQSAIEELDLEKMNVSGWILANETWTRTANTTFTVVGDLSLKYQAGYALKWTQTTVKYGKVYSAVYAAGTGLTTVTIDLLSTYVLTAATITDNYYSPMIQPIGFQPFKYAGNNEFYGLDTTGVYSSAAIEIREVGLVSTGQTANAYAPQLSFHWGGKSQSSIALRSDGVLTLRTAVDNGTPFITTGYIRAASCTLDSTNVATVNFSSSLPGTPQAIMLTPQTTSSGVIAAKVRSKSASGFTATVGGSGIGATNFDYFAIYTP